MFSNIIASVDDNADEHYHKYQELIKKLSRRQKNDIPNEAKISKESKRTKT